MKKPLKPIQKMSLSGMLAAVGCVLMLIGSAYGKADVFTAIVCSVCVAICSVHAGNAYGVACYGVISLVSVCFVPQKTAPLLFAVFFGYFPVLKAAIDKKYSYLSGLLVKVGCLNAAITALLLLAKTLTPLSWWVCLMVYAACNVALPFYDRLVAETRKRYESFIRRGGR